GSAQCAGRAPPRAAPRRHADAHGGTLRRAFCRRRRPHPRDLRDRLALRLGAARRPAAAAGPGVRDAPPRRRAGHAGNIRRPEGRAMSERPLPELRAGYRHFRVISTRWMDNDVYGHVNNVQYYSFFDTVVNGYLIAEGVLDPQASAADDRRVVTKANDFWGLTCPDKIKDDLRV